MAGAVVTAVVDEDSDDIIVIGTSEGGLETLDDLVGYLAADPASTPQLEAVRLYRERYGVTADA